MLERGFLADPVVDGQWWADVDVGRLLVAGTSDVSIGLQARRRDALDLIERHHLAGVPVVDDKGCVHPTSSNLIDVLFFTSVRLGWG